MTNINTVALSGNLTADAVKRGNKDAKVVAFSIAVNERTKKGDEWVDVPSFIDCVIFGDRGAKLADYLKKGTKVVVNGRLRQSTWETDGKKFSKLEVIVSDLDFVSAKKNDSADTSW